MNTLTFRIPYNCLLWPLRLFIGLSINHNWLEEWQTKRVRDNKNNNSILPLQFCQNEAQWEGCNILSVHLFNIFAYMSYLKTKEKRFLFMTTNVELYDP